VCLRQPIFLSIILLDVDRFLKFFYWHRLNKVVTNFYYIYTALLNYFIMCYNHYAHFRLLLFF